MEVRYQRELNGNYLVIRNVQSVSEDAVRMITENRIPGFLAVQEKQMNGEKEYYYDVTGKQTLQYVLERRPIAEPELRTLYRKIHRALDAAECFLLDYNGILLAPEFLYITPDFSDIGFCYCPGSGDFFQEIQKLNQFLLNQFDFKDRHMTEIVYELFRVSCQADFAFEDLLQVLNGASEPKTAEGSDGQILGIPDGESPDIPGKIGETLGSESVYPEEPYGTIPDSKEKSSLPAELLTVRTPASVWFWIPAAGILGIFLFWLLGGMSSLAESGQIGVITLSSAIWIAVGYYLFRRKKAADTSFGNEPWQTASEGDLCFSGKTEILGGIPEVPEFYCRLVSQNLMLYETIEISHFPYILGKQAEHCDGVIPLPVVSRVHARLDRREQHIYLTDIGSTNGTYLNRKKLTANQPVSLSEGDEVGLADLKYLFHRE